MGKGKGKGPLQKLVIRRVANRIVFEDPRSHILLADAKTVFAGARGRYDLIVSEPSNPWMAGLATLPSVPGAIRFLSRMLAKVPRVITRSLPRRAP